MTIEPLLNSNSLTDPPSRLAPLFDLARELAKMRAMRTRFTLVDVFTDVPFGGNQLAVFPDADSLSAGEMQTLAHEFNFSECSFVVRSETEGALRKIRTFTPTQEFLMAGHPTVGATWVLAARGDISIGQMATDVTLELGIGPTKVTVESIDGKPNFVWMLHQEAIFGDSRRDSRDGCTRYSSFPINQELLGNSISIPLHWLSTQHALVLQGFL